MNNNLSYNPTPQEYAAIYARKSNRMESNSIESQINVAKNKINELGLFVYDIFYDEESATRYHPLHRPGFKALLYAAKEGKFKTLIVFRRDRLARNVDNLLEIRNIFSNLEVKIIYSNEGEFQSSDSYISNFIENIIMAVDELEPSILHERILAGKKEKRLTGIIDGPMPFGLDKNKKTDEIFKIEEEAEVIKSIFNSFIDAEDTLDIWDKIQEKYNSKYEKLTNKKLYKLTIKKIITNPKYAGLIKATPSEPLAEIFKYNGDSIEVDETKFIVATNFEGFINHKNWFEAQKKYFLITEAENIIPSDPNDIFQNLLYCKKCNEKINLYNNTIYQCKYKCSSFDKDVLQTNLLRKITFDIFNSNNFIKYQNNIKEECRTEIKSLETTLNNIRLSREDIFKNLTDLANLKNNKNRLKELLDEENKIKKKLFVYQRDYIDKEITINELKTFKQDVNYTALILQLLQSQEYAKIMLSNIIKKINISGSKEANLLEKGNRIIEYNR